MVLAAGFLCPAGNTPVTKFELAIFLSSGLIATAVFKWVPKAFECLADALV
jgi:hypothetical protein